MEKLLALQKERQSVRPEEDLDRVRGLERQIQQVDEEIDRRVYALYGLTEEEIRIVESWRVPDPLPSLPPNQPRKERGAGERIWGKENVLF